MFRHDGIREKYNLKLGINTMVPFERLLKVMLQPWVAASYLGFVVLSFLYFDQSIAWFFYDLDLKTKLPIVYWLTKLGTGELYIVGLFLLILYFRYVRPNKTSETRSVFLWLCVFVPYMICAALKLCLGRARPALLFDNQIYGFFGFHLQSSYWSCPSGHTSTIMGLVAGLIILFPRYCYLFLCSGLLLISTRVLLTNHYLSDVMATAYLTFMEVAVLLWIMRRKAWLTSALQPMNFMPTT